MRKKTTKKKEPAPGLRYIEDSSGNLTTVMAFPGFDVILGTIPGERYKDVERARTAIDRFF